MVGHGTNLLGAESLSKALTLGPVENIDDTRDCVRPFALGG